MELLLLQTTGEIIICKGIMYNKDNQHCKVLNKFHFSVLIISTILLCSCILLSICLPAICCVLSIFCLLFQQHIEHIMIRRKTPNTPNAIPTFAPPVRCGPHVRSPGIPQRPWLSVKLEASHKMDIELRLGFSYVNM